MKNVKVNKIIAFMSCIALIIAIFSSSIFIKKNIKHNCSGEDCLICIEISQCKNNINILGYSPLQKFTLSIVLFVFIIETIVRLMSFNDKPTLITWKVELLD